MSKGEYVNIIWHRMIMKVFEDYLNKIKDDKIKTITIEVLEWVQKEYPQLVPVFKWSQPMFTHNGTFIIGFHASKKQLSVTPENDVIEHFKTLFEENGLEYSIKIVKMKWSNPVNYDVIKELIDHNLKEKQGCTTFWK